jgi:hypothetical protein
LLALGIWSFPSLAHSADTPDCSSLKYQQVAAQREGPGGCPSADQALPATVGQRGPRGSNGQTGPTGSRGEKGDKGDRGPAGPPGLTGETGAKGDRGDKGDRGQEGPAGRTGDPGRPGDRGEKGDSGERGPQGPSGVCSNACGTDESPSQSAGHGQAGNSRWQKHEGEPGSPVFYVVIVAILILVLGCAILYFTITDWRDLAVGQSWPRFFGQVDKWNDCYIFQQ